MSRITPFGCFLFVLFIACVVLAGRSDMLRWQQDQRDAERIAAAGNDARIEMAARAAEDKCGQLVAVKRASGWACVPLKRSM